MTRPGGTGSAGESTRPYAAPTGRSRLRAGTFILGGFERAFDGERRAYPPVP